MLYIKKIVLFFATKHLKEGGKKSRCLYFILFVSFVFWKAEEKARWGLSYKEVGTEVFLLDGDEENQIGWMHANLDTIDWF